MSKWWAVTAILVVGLGAVGAYLWLEAAPSGPSEGREAARSGEPQAADRTSGKEGRTDGGGEAASGSSGEQVDAPIPDDLIPKVLVSELRSRGSGYLTLHNYLERLAFLLRRHAGDDEVLDKADIERFRQETEAKLRARFLSEIMSHDLDGDGVVTRGELGEARSLPPALKAEPGKPLTVDVNGDGRIETSEVMNMAPQFIEYRMKRIPANLLSLQRLYALDPDADGKLFGPELQELGREAFAQFDADGNERLSAGELEARKTYMEANSESWRILDNIARCPLPPADPDDVIVLINFYGAEAYASVTVAGQDRVTGTTHLFIEPGPSQLYIVASALSPTVWRLSGAVGRIARFVTWPGSIGHDGVGVTGLPEKRIDFITGGLCFNASEGTEGRAIVEGRLERPVTHMVAGHEITDVAVPSGGSRFTPPGRNGRMTRLQDVDTPPGVDPWLYLRLADDAPAGVVEIDADQVVSPGKVEDYEVLPRYAGLVQLMKEGRIEAVTGDGERHHPVAPVLRITKPIPRFPAGLAGNYVLKYRIGKDVPDPAGRVPAKNVTCEATGGPAEADSDGRPVCTGG